MSKSSDWARNLQPIEPGPEHHVITDLAARLAKAERERDELRVAIMGARADPSVTHGQFIEMAKSTEAARRGGLARAEAAERERDEARAEIERMTPRYVAYDYLESPAILAALDAAGYVVVQREPTEGMIPAAGSIDFPYHDIRDDRAMIAAQESKP